MAFDDGADYWLLWYDFERRQKRREPEWERELTRSLESPAPTVSGDFVADYLDDTAKRAGDTCRKVEHEIYVRTKLHDEGIAQINYQITEAGRSLECFSGWGVGYNRGVDEKRLSLERRLDSLRHEKRTLRIQLWNDLVRLRRDLAERQKEYEAVRRRLRVR